MPHFRYITSRISRLIVAISVAASAGGCVVEWEEMGELALAGGCGTVNCTGSNAAFLDDVVASPLSESTAPMDEQPNEFGADYLGFQSRDGVPHELEVVNGEFVATDSNGQTLTGPELIDFKLLVYSGGRTYPVYITSYQQAATWTNDPQPISLYGLAYPANIATFGSFNGTPDPATLFHLCADQSDPTSASVALIADETYDEDAKKVIAGMPQWFNMACEGYGLYKMALLNYGPDRDWNNTGSAASLSQRQATIKMIPADYCGKGESFTETGTPLIWMDREDTVYYDSNNVGALEALWDENGAICLDVPRNHNYTYNDIASTCFNEYSHSLPHCTPAHLSGPWVWKTHLPLQ